MGFWHVTVFKIPCIQLDTAGHSHRLHVHPGPSSTVLGILYAQGFDWFFKDVSSWVRNDRLVVGVQLRLVGPPEQPSPDDTAASAPAAYGRPATAAAAAGINGASATNGTPTPGSAAAGAPAATLASRGAAAASPAESLSGN